MGGLVRSDINCDIAATGLPIPVDRDMKRLKRQQLPKLSSCRRGGVKA
jgi:hypothetical protein